MPKTIEGPAELHGVIEQVEDKIENLMGNLEKKPRESRIYLGNEPYMLMSLESLAVDLREEMGTFLDPNGVEMVLYRFGKAIGRSAAKEIMEALDLSFMEKIVAGPIFASYAGFVKVKLLPGSNIEKSDDFLAVYEHPNNFEAQYLKDHKEDIEEPVCYFNAGYSAGWESIVFDMDIEATEVQCEAAGDPTCRFIMYPASKTTEYREKLDKFRGPIEESS